MNNIEISAAHGLLALRDQNPLTPPSDFYSDTPVLQYNHIVRHNRIGYQEVSFENIPTNEQVNNCLAQRLNSMAPYTQRPHHHHIQSNTGVRKHTPSTSHSLPSINEMLSNTPTPARGGRFMLYSKVSRSVRSTAFHPYNNNNQVFHQAKKSTSQEQANQYQVQQRQQHQQYQQYQQHQQHQQQHQQRFQHLQHLQNNTQLKQRYVQQQPPAQGQQQILNSIKSLSEAELHLLFQGLKEHYLEKYDKVLTLKELEAEQMELDEDDSADDSLHTVSDTMNESNKKSAGRRKKVKNSSDKPRWTPGEKADLFEAVIRHKSLNVMNTFDWGVIGADIGRADKACKDQWRRGVLKMLRDSFFSDL